MQRSIQRLRGLWWPRVWQLAAALLLALYVGRVLSELARPGNIAIISITALSVVTALWLSRFIPSRYTWTTLPLAAYVLHPELNLRLAGAVLLVATVALAAQLATEEYSPLARLLNLLQRQILLLTVAVMTLYSLLYISTTAPGLLPADNGELQLVAAQLGVAHPPGFALYTVLAHLATRLPLGHTAAYQVNLLSAFTGAVTIGVLFLSAWLLTRRITPALLAALALGSATTFWSQSTTANVRSLTALFTALALLCLLVLWQRKQLAEADGEEDSTVRQKQQNGALYVALGLLLGLGITHHASLLFIGLIFIVYLLWLDPALLHQPHRWPGPVLGFLAGLLPLLYFPLRASSGAHGASPTLATLDGFLEHVLALGFRGDLFAFNEPALLWERLKVMGGVMLFQFHPLLLAGMVLGFLLLLWRQPKTAFLLGGSFTLHTLVTATYRAPQTVEYMLPAYVPAALLLACGVGLWTVPGQDRRQQRYSALYRIQYLFLGLLLISAMGQTLQHYRSYALLSEDQTARSYSNTLLEQAPPQALLLADWHWATPLWYLQEIEGHRPDVEVEYVFPTAEPYGVTWARRIAEAYESGRPVVATHFDAGTYSSLPPLTPLGDAYLFRQSPLDELPADFEPLDLDLGGRIAIRGYRLTTTTVAPTYETALLLAWEPLADTPTPLTLFAHLVSADGRLHAQKDVAVVPQDDGLTITRLPLTPRPGTAPDDYSLLVGAYESATGNPLLTPDNQPRRRIGSVAVHTMTIPLATTNATSRPLASEGLLPHSRRRLIGYDWDNTIPQQPRLYLHWQTNAGFITDVEDVPTGLYQLPPHYGAWGLVIEDGYLENDGAHYIPLGPGIIWQGEQQLASRTPGPGEQLTLLQHFSASRPVMRDYVTSVRLIGYQNDGFSWAWWDLHDSVPAMGAIPTLKWIAGSQVRDPHFPTVSDEATPGQQLGGILQLYDAFTQEVVPILDERIVEGYLGIPLGSTRVEP